MSNLSDPIADRRQLVVLPIEDQPADGSEQALSALIEDIANRSGERITIQQLMERFGGRAMGGLLLIFGLLCTLPLPPGATTIFGAPLLLLAPQMMIGKTSPWLPRKLREHSIATADFRKGVPRLLPWLRRIEAISRPRMAFLFGASGQRAIGLVCTLLAIVLILPIPFGNLLPAAAVAMLSLAVVQRDGVLAALGYALTVASVGLLVLAAGMITAAAHHLIAFVTGA